jgi:amidase
LPSATCAIHGGHPHPRKRNRSPIDYEIVTGLEGVDPDPAVEEGLRRAAQALQRAGYSVEEVTPPRFQEAADLWSPFDLSEIGPGLRSSAQQFGDQKIQNAIATWLELTPLLDLAGFSQALGRRDQILREWRVFMETYPIILTPVSWREPFPIDFDQQGPAAFAEIVKAQSPMLSVAFLGLPGLTVPTGVVEGLPTAVQIVADRFREELCFDAGEVIEDAIGALTPIDPRPTRTG